MVKHFADFAWICDTLRFIYISIAHHETSLFIGFSTILRRFHPFAYVELEGVECEKGNTFVYRSFTAVC